MSHVAAIELQVKSLPALQAAATRLGLEFVEGQQTYKWFGRWVGDYHGEDAAYKQVDAKTFGTCQHALRIPGNAAAYEVGVIDNGDGTYKLLWDFWAGGKGLLEKIGRAGEKLKQAYGIEAAKAAARKQGLHVTEKVGANGAVKLVMRKAGA